MNPNCNKAHCPEKNDHNCSASPEICHGECTEAPSDWKKDFEKWWILFATENFDLGTNDPDHVRYCKMAKESTRKFITDLIQKKESAARKDERERCVEAVKKALNKIEPLRIGHYSCRVSLFERLKKSTIQAIRNRKDV